MYLRMQEVPDLKRKTLQEFVDAHVEQGATVECDGFQAYPGLKNVCRGCKSLRLRQWGFEVAPQGTKQSEGIPDRNLPW